MKKLLIVLFLLPFALLAQKMNGVYTRSELTAQKPPQCTTCLVIEGDSVGLFVYDKNDDSSLASTDIIVNTHKNWRWKRARYAGAINFGNASYYTKAQLDPTLNAKVNIGSIGSNSIAMYDASNKSIYSSNIFNANGKIGINTTNPTEQLHVNGNVRFRSIKSWSRMDIEGQQLGGDINQNLSGITFGNWLNSGGGYVLGGGGGAVGDWNYDDPYIYLKGNKGVAISTGSDNFGNTAGIFVDTLRRVGIRRTTPTYTLDVAGTTRVDSSTYLATLINTGVVIGSTAYIGYKLDVDGWMRTKSNTFLASDGGNVGVGTITPTAKLEIKSPSAEIVRINTSTTSQQGYIGFSENGTLKQSLGLQTDNTFFLYDNVYARDMIKTTGAGNISFVPGSGSVGVGTTSPTTTLDVNGTAKLTPVSAATASGYTPVEGQIVIVNTTNATFTSLGLWSYANGAWRK